jgi:hypothetical protein
MSSLYHEIGPDIYAVRRSQRLSNKRKWVPSFYWPPPSEVPLRVRSEVITVAKIQTAIVGITTSRSVIGFGSSYRLSFLGRC